MDAQFVYLMLDSRNGHIKIGISADPTQREKTLQSEQPRIKLFACAPGGRDFEVALHDRWHCNRVRGEWFILSPIEIKEILQLGFSSVDSGKDIFEAYFHGITVEALTTERLIAQALSPQQDEAGDDYYGDDPDVYRLSDGLEEFLEQGFPDA